jgi:hypothetical protein
MNGWSLTATTFVALLAVASATAVTPSVPVLYVPGDLGGNEQATVRAMAAAVAAIARDLLGTDQTVCGSTEAAPPMVLSGTTTLAIAPGQHTPVGRRTAVSHRELDLPPPVC